jgi:CBS domain-containing protein
MKHDPITVTGDADLIEAAQIMSNNRISGLPVVNSVDNLDGIVTKTDITKALAAIQYSRYYSRYVLPGSSRILTTSIKIFLFLFTSIALCACCMTLSLYYT